MSKRVTELLDSSFKVLLAEFERDRGIPHSGTKGAAREHGVTRFLREILPSRFGISSGHIITADDEWSTQQDVIVFDRLGSPLVGNLGTAGKVVFAESVLAAVEVKSTLNSTTKLNEMHDKADLLRSLRRKVVRTNLAPGIALQKGKDQPSILCGGFVFEAGVSLGTIRENFRKAHKENRCLDLLCVLKEKNAESAIFVSGPGDIFYAPDSHEESHLSVLKRFVFELLRHLQDSGPFYPAPDLEAYTEVYRLDRLQELLKRFGRATLEEREFVEMVHRVLSTMPKFYRDSDVFMFAGPEIGEGAMQAQMWMYDSLDGRKPITVGEVQPAVEKKWLGKALTENEATLLQSLVQWFERMKQEKARLVIKQP